MENQKFVPEGWNENGNLISKEDLKQAWANGNIMQAKVIKCDQSYNLYVKLNKELTGIIPREEVEAINIDETGFPKPSICVNKVNKFVQFKVKDILPTNEVILSRKSVGKDAIQWMRNDLEEGQVVFRNCKKYKTIWSIYRNRWRTCRTTSHRRYVCSENKKSIRKI